MGRLELCHVWLLSRIEERFGIQPWRHFLQERVGVQVEKRGIHQDRHRLEFRKITQSDMGLSFARRLRSETPFEDSTGHSAAELHSPERLQQPGSGRCCRGGASVVLPTESFSSC